MQTILFLKLDYCKIFKSLRMILVVLCQNKYLSNVGGCVKLTCLHSPYNFENLKIFKINTYKDVNLGKYPIIIRSKTLLYKNFCEFKMNDLHISHDFWVPGSCNLVVRVYVKGSIEIICNFWITFDNNIHTTVGVLKYT